MDVISQYGKNYKYNKWDPANWNGFQVIGIVVIVWVIIFAGAYYYTNVTMQEDRVYITRQLQTQDIPVGSQLILEYTYLTKDDIDYAMSYGYEVVCISNLPKDRSLVAYKRVN